MLLLKPFRLFYHRPIFALLDESTSAVSAEVEEALLAACIHEAGCTLITITHRPQVIKYHQVKHARSCVEFAAGPTLAHVVRLCPDVHWREVVRGAVL
jgi:ABC-type uncharacterized transport system fused permease/ATPase subunit